MKEMRRERRMREVLIDIEMLSLEWVDGEGDSLRKRGIIGKKFDNTNSLSQYWDTGRDGGDQSCENKADIPNNNRKPRKRICAIMRTPECVSEK